jgi:hypothetical protein
MGVFGVHGDAGHLCAVALGALTSATEQEPVFVGGASVVAQSFEAVETVRAVLQVLEQQFNRDKMMARIE